MRDVLLTGAGGTIGTVISSRVTRPFRSFDVPDFDARHYEQVCEQMKGCESVIHLAWDTKTDNFRTGETDPENYGMTQNILRAAHATGTKRVILASSIHADIPKVEPGGQRSPYRLPYPDSPYGASKVAMETLGRYYAEYKELEVIALRFGWVHKDQSAKPAPGEGYPLSEAWLSHDDLQNLIERCLVTEEVPGNYQIIYGVSERKGGVYDCSNAIGWKPRTKYTA